MNIFTLSLENSEKISTETISDVDAIEAEHDMAELQQEADELNQGANIANNAMIAVEEYEAGDVTSEAAINDFYNKLHLFGDSRPGLTVEDSRGIIEKIKDIIRTIVAKIVIFFKKLSLKVKTFLLASEKKIEAIKSHIKETYGDGAINPADINTEKIGTLAANFDKLSKGNVFLDPIAKASKWLHGKIFTTDTMLDAFNKDVKNNTKEWTNLEAMSNIGSYDRLKLMDGDKTFYGFNIYGTKIVGSVLDRDNNFKLKTYTLEPNKNITVDAWTKKDILDKLDLVSKTIAGLKGAEVFSKKMEKVGDMKDVAELKTTSVVRVVNHINNCAMAAANAAIRDASFNLKCLIELSKLLPKK